MKKLDNRTFRLICTTLHKPRHYIGVFELNGDKYVVDDLDQSVVRLQEKENTEHFNLPVSTSMYYDSSKR